MIRKSTIALCALLLLLSTAASADITVRHVPGAGSGACLARSANVCLSARLGRCVGVHALRIPDSDGESDDVRMKRYDAAGFDGGMPQIITGLGPSYPNPLNPATSIEYSVKAHSRVLLRIYSVEGELVRTLVDERVEAGIHIARWDGMNARGNEVASGIYFVRLDTEWGVFSCKVVVTR